MSKSKKETEPQKFDLGAILVTKTTARTRYRVTKVIPPIYYISIISERVIPAFEIPRSFKFVHENYELCPSYVFKKEFEDLLDS